MNEKQAVSDLEKAIAAQPSLKGNVWLGGPTTADVQIAAVSSQDLGRAELFALPFLILLLFFVFRGIRAASMPLIGAIFAIAVTLGVMGLIMVALPLSVFALNLVIALGLGLSVDFSLLIVSRFREEYDRQGSTEAALAIVRRTAGRTVLFSSLTIAAAMATLAIFPERFVYSMGIAGAVVVLSAGVFALFVLPSLLTIYGDRIAARGPSRRHGRSRRLDRRQDAGTGSPPWSCADPPCGPSPPSSSCWCWPLHSCTSPSPEPMRAACRPAARPGPPMSSSRPSSVPSRRRQPA